LATGDSFEAVVLAAGSGRRFGGGKLLADWHGRPLLHAALSAASAAPVRGITLVAGADAQAVAAAAKAFDPAIRIVRAADHAEGMAASLRAGIAALAPEIDAAFIFLADMPRVPHAVLAPLARAVADGALAAAPVFEGTRGNPVVLARALFGEVAALRGDLGARPILARLGDGLALVESPDAGVLFDVDGRGDLAR
jgi:molybdenum cofactor cytidylyltransferase